eukprot:gene2677-2978_t
MGRLGHYDWQAMRHITQLAKTQAKDMSASNLSSMLLGLAKLHHYDEQLCLLLAEAAEAAMPAASGAQVIQKVECFERFMHLKAAMIMWALATLKVDHPGVFAAAARQAILRSGQLEPRHVSNLAWAFTVRKAFHPGLFDALAARVLQLGPGTLDPHHLSLIAWSFAKQGHRVQLLMQFIGDQAINNAGELLPQNISNLAWAFGCLSVPHPQLFAALADAAKFVHLEGFGNQNISDLAWGCAAAGFKVLWALKKLEYRNAEMEQQLAEVIPDIAGLLDS